MTQATQELWAFINSFAEWFSALATAAAVVVALYLSRRDDAKVRVSAGLRRLHWGADAPRPEVVNVEVVNIGRRPVELEALHWRVGLFRRTLFFWMAPVEFGSAKLPIRLEEGQRANYFMAVERMPEMFEPIAQNLTRSWVRRRFAPVRVSAMLSTGQAFSHPIEQELRNRIVALVNAPH